MINTFNNPNSSRLSQIDQNQFMFSPSRIAGFNTKDETIKKLQQKNQRLRNQIRRIDKVLQQPSQKTVYGVKIPQMTKQVTQQELDNAYKRIKAYQHQIQKIKGINNSGTYIQQIKKAEQLLKQKEELSEKLRRELAEIKKTSKQLTKQLKNDYIKQQYENKSLKLNTEIKWLREKVKQAENHQQTHKRNYERQSLFIKKLEIQLIKEGYPESTLQALKNKYMWKGGQRTQYSRMSHVREQKQEFVQDRTPQAYKIGLNQIKLLQKMEKDYNQKLEFIAKQNQEASLINLKSRNRLLEVEDEIDRIQNHINDLKKMIDPAKLKPQRALSSMQANVGRYGRVNKSLTAIKSAFNHIYKHQQFGKVGRNARRFSDRPKIGKNPAKIIAIDFYESKEGECNLVGIQATYQIKQAIKKGPLNMIVDPKTTAKKSVNFVDPGDYLKGVECIINQKGVIIGISVMSAKGASNKAGPSQGTRRPLNISRLQYPVCIYGSFGEKGLELFGVQVIEQENENN